MRADIQVFRFPRVETSGRVEKARINDRDSITRVHHAGGGIAFRVRVIRVAEARRSRSKMSERAPRGHWMLIGGFQFQFAWLETTSVLLASRARITANVEQQRGASVSLAVAV